MSRSDLVVSLAQAGELGDRPMLHRTVKALAQEARAKQQHTYANRLTDVIKGEAIAPERLVPRRARMPDAIRDTVLEAAPSRRVEDLILPKGVTEDLVELFHEHRSFGLLRSHSLEPRHTILLIGPPGNGKTSLAEAIAAEVGYAFLVVRYEGLIGSYLGETASQLKKVLDYAASTPSVLFFDEIDAIGKERGDVHETGEVKRVVNALLVQMDALPTHSILIGATNHPDMLDKAIWRRFELALTLPNPNLSQVTEWFERFLREIDTPGGVSAQKLARTFKGCNFAELEQFTLDVRRRHVLQADAEPWSETIDRVLARWTRKIRVTKPSRKPNALQLPDLEAD